MDYNNNTLNTNILYLIVTETIIYRREKLIFILHVERTLKNIMTPILTTQ